MTKTLSRMYELVRGPHQLDFVFFVKKGSWSAPFRDRGWYAVDIDGYVRYLGRSSKEAAKQLCVEFYALNVKAQR